MSLADIIERRVRPCTVAITVARWDLESLKFADVHLDNPGSALSAPLGTGILIDDLGHVVTAGHVAHDVMRHHAPPDIEAGIAVLGPNTDNERASSAHFPFSLVATNTVHDLALLKMPDDAVRRLVDHRVEGRPDLARSVSAAQLRVTRPRDGDAIAISGYPFNHSYLITASGIVASAWPMIIGLRRGEPEPRDIYLADVQTNPGHSGAPVYSTVDGGIIGMHVSNRLRPVLGANGPAQIDDMALEADAGLAVVIPARYIAQMLDEHGIAWTAAADHQSGGIAR
jgi:S1-C subfamily serine protease